MRQKVGLVCLALLAGLLSGCSGDVRIENPGASDKDQPQAQETPTEDTTTSETASTVSTGGIGDTLEGSLTRITLNSVSFAKPSQFLEPEYGNYIVLNFTLENYSDESVNVSSFASFELQGSDLYVYASAFGVETRGSLDSTIAPGSSLRGEIAFDVPNVESFDLKYKENMFSESTTVFQFRFSEIKG
jgi:hypothetical protein